MKTLQEKYITTYNMIKVLEEYEQFIETKLYNTELSRNIAEFEFTEKYAKFHIGDILYDTVNNTYIIIIYPIISNGCIEYYIKRIKNNLKINRVSIREDELTQNKNMKIALQYKKPELNDNAFPIEIANVVYTQPSDFYLNNIYTANARTAKGDTLIYQCRLIQDDPHEEQEKFIAIDNDRYILLNEEGNPITYKCPYINSLYYHNKEDDKFFCPLLSDKYNYLSGTIQIITLPE